MIPTRRWFIVYATVFALAMVVRLAGVEIPAWVVLLASVVLFMLTGLAVGDYTADKRRSRRDARRSESVAWGPTDDQQR